MLDDCLVCREHRMEVPLPGEHLVSTEEVVAFHLPPWPPPAEDVYLGYLMVTPRRHAADFAELTDRESAAVGQWIARLSRSLKDLGAERVYLAVVGHGCTAPKPCPVPKLRAGLLVCSCGQAARWRSLSRPPGIRYRRTGASIGTTTPGS